MDARTGEVLHASNADTRLHPASLTKMMTLYVAFEAIERGEISLDSKVTISKHAAGQAPSKLGLRPGQKIALRYLIRAAAVKSANDAATAIGEAIEGSESAFAKRMNRTAKALGMKRSTFKNANGLTAEGHLSTARDMTTLGRRLFYDFPQYYNIFSRRTADAGITQVSSTNRRFLDSYEGADGIKTGYTGAAGFNLTASAQRGKKRIIATVFGAKSTASRNARMVELLDMGFGLAPKRAVTQEPAPPVYDALEETEDQDMLASAIADAVASGVASEAPAAGKTIRVNAAVTRSPRPAARPAPKAEPAEELLVADAATAVIDATPEAEAIAEAPAAEEPSPEMMAAMTNSIGAALAEAQEPAFEQTTAPQPETAALAEAIPETGTEGPAESNEMAEAPLPEAPAGEPQGPVFAQTTAPQPETLAATGEAAPDTSTEAGAQPVVVASADAEAPRPAARPEELAVVAVPETAIAEAVDVAVAESSDAAQVEAEPVEELIALAPPVETPTEAPAETSAAQQEPVTLAAAVATPEPRPELIVLDDQAQTETAEAELEMVTRVSASGGRQWGINVGKYPSRYEAERVLLQTALVEMNTLAEALRKVANRKGGFDANFVGMSQEEADLACRRLQARGTDCTVLGPTG